MSALNDAIENLYLAFSDVPKPESIDLCPCCLKEDEALRLLSTPLREITPDQLSRYAFSALLTMGGVADYLYFFPRIMELTVRDELLWPDIEVTASRINTAEYKSWPVERRSAFLALLDAQFDHLLEVDEDGEGKIWEIDSWMCAFAILDLDLSPYLEKVALNPQAVMAYFEMNAKPLGSRRLMNSFWEPTLPNRGHDKIVEWFYSPEIRKIPTDAFGYIWSPSEESGDEV